MTSPSSHSSGVRYDRSPEEWRRCLEDGQRAEEARTWTRVDTLDAWRHDRMRARIDPFLRDLSTGRWLTVGDGRFGNDAHFLRRRGIDVHASDVDDTLLRIGAEQGLIGSYSAENAEALSFGDDSFDYVFCKEAFHHFPRPWIALYEMLRVARRGVILIEPGDSWIDRAGRSLAGHGVAALKSCGRALLGRSPRPRHRFEQIGNYVFSLSPWECEKVQLGLHQRHLAWCGINDTYIKGVEFCPINGGSGADERLRQRLFRGLQRQDQLSRFTGCWGLQVIALFCQPPAANLWHELSKAGWTTKELPRNPYL
ncbi:MAG: methyltransferase domain-containing protein [Cyanobacteriota bacterium]|nr:methyltransferase domain-containing protein [Cyanobacteriota bacterium]